MSAVDQLQDREDLRGPALGGDLPGAVREIAPRQFFERLDAGLAAARVAVAGQIDQVKRRLALDVDPIDVEQTRLARRRAGARQPDRASAR